MLWFRAKAMSSRNSNSSFSQLCSIIWKDFRADRTKRNTSLVDDPSILAKKVFISVSYRDCYQIWLCWICSVPAVT